jgi:Rhs element Vgr protein
MAQSPRKNSGDLFTYSIESAGAVISGSYPAADISITTALNKISTATFHIQDGDLPTHQFPATNSPSFVPGTEIQIFLGYNNTNTLVFSGIVVSQSVSLNNGGIMLEVSCKDKATKMTIDKKNNSYSDKTDSEIISDIIDTYSLDSEIDDTTTKYEELVQNKTTDWDFLMTRAELNGMYVVADKTIFVKKPDFTAAASLQLTYGEDIIDFQASLSATSQITSVTAKSWDYTTQSVIQATSNITIPNLQGNLSTSSLSSVMAVNDFELQSSGLVTVDELTSWANTQLLKFALSRVIGSVTCTGTSLPVPGQLMEFINVSARFDGKAFISSVSHNVSDGEWTTSIDFGLESEWFSEKSEPKNTDSGGVTSNVKGLMNGKVKQLDQDPDGQYRILLTFPLMPSSADGVWARLATFYATNGQGIFFIPEIGDEVVVGFLDDNPRFPIILGSLYSTNQKSPNDLTAENYTKAIITKSECKIAFDDENKVITITTPGNNQMVYSDKDKGITITDQNNNQIQLGSDGITITDKSNNKITMSSSGIEISSASDIQLKATGDISLTSTGNTKVAATANFTGSGAEVSLTANTVFKASGTASTEVSSSGNTAIKGTMVMIN